MSKLSRRQALIRDVVFAFLGMAVGRFVGNKWSEMREAEGERKVVVCSRCGARCY